MDTSDRAIQDQRFRELVAAAHAAGTRAGVACKPTPMTVIGMRGERYRVEDGPCGFASIHFKGNTAFGRWAKREGLAKRDSYRGGLYVWVNDFGQSYERKRAYANAFADVLIAGGIAAFTHARLD